ncbi:LytTR family transcriptional regulator, partial [Candidatus Falkowbacteria bacterium]|nr:LytTR family transcriptional regulator [Candidatus Falkowbacteria bacterium]
MTGLGALGFASPALLWGLLALPILWVLLRAVPPAPIRRLFPGVALLLGLADETQQADRTPWWLLLLRMAALAAAIIGFAGPVLNPEVKTRGAGPLLIVVDASWASARDWPRRAERIGAALAEAALAG